MAQASSPATQGGRGRCIWIGGLAVKLAFLPHKVAGELYSYRMKNTKDHRMKKTRIGRFSSRLVMVASMASIVLLGCCQWLRAEPPGQPSKKEILNASPGSYDYLRLNKYPV